MIQSMLKLLCKFSYSINYYHKHKYHKHIMTKRLALPELQIVYEDNDIIIVDKPYDMLSVRGKLTNDNNTIKLSRSEEWKVSISQASLNSNEYFPNDEVCRNALDKLVIIPSIPRKKKLFQSFLSRVLKITDDSIQISLWDAIYDTDTKLHSRDLNMIPDKQISAVDIVESLCNQKVYVVHRLDMETSGLLLFAKNEDSCAELSRQFREREIHKIYIAKVAPSMISSESMTKICIPIRPDLNNRPMQIVDYDNGKSCETHCYIIHNDKDWSFVKLVPITGRTHQLRLHMASIKFPILGDSLYASPEIYKAENRLCLHAFSIQFKHPITKEMKQIYSSYCEFIDTSHFNELRQNCEADHSLFDK